MNTSCHAKAPARLGYSPLLKSRGIFFTGFLFSALGTSAWANMDDPNYTIAEWTEQYNAAHSAAVKSQQASEDYFAKHDIKAHCVADRDFLIYFQRKLMISQKISGLVSKDSRYDDKSRKALADQVASIQHGVKLTQRGVDLVCGTDEEKRRAIDDNLEELNGDIKNANASGEAHLVAGNEAAQANDSAKACKEIAAAVADFTTTREGIISLLKLIGDGSQLTAKEKSSEHKYAETLAEEIDGLQKGFIDTECKSPK